MHPALCPICSKPTEADTAPFCSVRCRNVDLGRWFTGAYAVPSAELEEGEEDALALPDPTADPD
jgi:endogenous inhibitor of DNA gyrase (YacG/DUF329 family)